jgi:tetratricopeptide (TPR) repeat protein
MSGPFDDDDERSDPEADALDALGSRFLAALEAKDQGKVDVAEEALRTILSEEPRLAEPRMELARLLLDSERIEEAEDHAREALEQLDTTGPWTDELPPNVIKALGHALLAEILRRRADDDDVIFGDPAAFKALIAESKQHFEAAAALDPSDEYASYHAFFLGVKGHGAKADLGDGILDDSDSDDTDVN